MNALVEALMNIEKYSENDDLKAKQNKALELIKESSGLIEFKGATDSYWKDLETADTKVMILSIPDGTFIRSAKDLKQELSAEDVNGNFLILDGLAYKSNNDYESIVYMKV
jgi:hypothetical protein